MTFYPPPSQDPSDPQAQQQQPYGQPQGQPYGQQPYPPQPQGQAYGQQPYGSMPPPPYNPYPAPQSGNGLAVAALVCGLVGLLIFNIILGPLAIVFGAIGRGRANRGASGGGMALAGIILGVVDVALFIILLAVITNRGFVY